MDIVGLWDRLDSHLVGTRYKHIVIVKRDGTKLTRVERGIRLLARNFPILLCFSYFLYLLAQTVSVYDEAALLDNQYRLYLLRSLTLVTVAVPIFFSIILQVIWQSQVLFHPERRGLWDRIYDTYVIHDHESRQMQHPTKAKAKKLFAPVVRFCAVMGAFFVFILTIWVGLSSYDPKLHSDYQTFFGQDIEKVPHDQNGLSMLKAMASPKNHLGDDYVFPPFTRPLSCYLIQSKLYKLKQKCATELEILKRVEDQKPFLLAYYQKIYDAPFFQEQDGNDLSIQETRLVSDLHQLQLASWALMLKEGQSSPVIKAWLQDTKYWQKAMRGGLSIDMRGFVASLYYRNLKFLPVLLSGDVALIKEYQMQLTNILTQPILADGAWDLQKAWHFELQKLNADGFLDTPFNFYLKTNHTKNMIFELAQDYKMMAVAPAVDFYDMNQVYKSKYRRTYHHKFFKKLVYNPIGHMMLYGMYQSPELISSAHHYTAYQRQLRIYMMAKMNKVPNNEMQDFIDKLPKELMNPYTNNAFLWDEKEAVLYYHDEQNSRISHLRAMQLFF